MIIQKVSSLNKRKKTPRFKLSSKSYRANCRLGHILQHIQAIWFHRLEDQEYQLQDSSSSPLAKPDTQQGYMVQILCPQLHEQLSQVSGSGISPCLRSHSRGSPHTSFLCHSTVENTTNAYQYFKMCLSFPDMVLRCMFTCSLYWAVFSLVELIKNLVYSRIFFCWRKVSNKKQAHFFSCNQHEIHPSVLL